MSRYFHAYTKKYDKYRSRAMILTAVPLAQFSMLIIWALMFNLKRAVQPDFFIPYASAICISILAGMLLCWLYSAIAEHHTRVNRRYTYFEITPKAAVFSKYQGSYTRFGKRIILRRVCLIPLKSYENAYLDEKKKHLILTGEIRIYEGENLRLGYHVKDGLPVFDNWWYNEAEKAYRIVDMIRLPMDFEHPGEIAAALHRAKRKFDAMPPKKAYVFREADIVKKRRELKKLAESRRYIRTW